MNREHEQINERTEKIKSEWYPLHYPFYYIRLTILEAVKIYFFDNNDVLVSGFWDYEGKVIRQNQRRGFLFRNKLL